MIFGRSRMKEELIRKFRNGLADGGAAAGVKDVATVVGEKEAEAILVCKNVIGKPGVKDIVKKAKDTGIPVIMLDPYSNEGALLHSCNDIGAVVKMVVAKKERLSKIEESELVGEFINKLDSGRAVKGLSDVAEAIDNSEATLVLVNDSAFNKRRIRDAVDKAERLGIDVKVLHSEDLPGIELRDVGGVACFIEPASSRKSKLNKRDEIVAMEELIKNTSEGKVARHPGGVSAALKERNAVKIFVNDNVRGRAGIKSTIRNAKLRRVPIKVFNAKDELGVQLAKNGSIVCITKAKVTGTGRKVKR